MTRRVFPIIYANTAPSSPLRRLVVHEATWEKHRDWHLDIAIHLPKEMLVDIIIEFRNAVPNSDGERDDHAFFASDYYVPEEE